MRACAQSVLTVAITLLHFGLSAQERDLTSLSLEDFLNVEVTSVNKVPQKLTRSAAAVYVVTQDDIRRSGATNLPEALRLAPGVSVARITGTTWAISIRGFNSIYSNKLLVMVDGRTVYSALLSGVVWTDQILMLEDIERIEVIRGPGGTMWGANAVSGVINIISRNTKDTLGGVAAITGGSLDPLTSRVRYGGKFNEETTWRLWSQFSLQGETTFPNLPVSVNRWEEGRAGMRVDSKLGQNDALLVEGEFEKNSSQVPAVVALGADSGSVMVRDTGSAVAYLMSRWNHTTADGNEFALQAYYNENRMNGGAFTASIRTLDLDVHYSYQLTAAHTLMAGGGMRADLIKTSGTPTFYYSPGNRNYYIYNAFLQDEWQLFPNLLTATFGAKLEHYTQAGVALEPTARLMWTPTEKQGYWVSASQAIRTPAHTDYASQVDLPTGVSGGVATGLDLQGSQGFKPEVLRALETGGRWMFGRRLAVDVALFRHWYSRLENYSLQMAGLIMTPLPGSGVLVEIPALTTNGAHGVNQGGEASAHLDAGHGLQITGSYSSVFSQTRLNSGVDPATSFLIPSYTPKHQWQVRASWDFRRHWSSQLAFYRVGALADGALPGYSRMDFHIARKLGEFTELSVSGQNLLRPRQQEFIGNILYPSGAIARSVQIGMRWNFR